MPTYDQNLGVYRDANGQVVNKDGSAVNSGASSIKDEDFGRAMGFEGGLTGFESVKSPYRTADQIASDTRASNIKRDLADQATTATANNAHVGTSAGRAAAAAQDTHASSVAGRGAGIELPFIGAIPYAGPVLEGLVEGVQGGALSAADYAVENPLTTLATGGIAAGVAGADKLVDETASGVAQGIQGNSRATVDIPLTPAQLWDPEGPLYDPGNIDGSGTVNAYGIKDGINAVGDFLGGLGGPGGGGAGGGGGSQVAANLIENAGAEQARTRQLGTDILSGRVGGSNPADRQLQENELAGLNQFVAGPREGETVLNQVDRLLAGPGAQQNVFSEASRARATPGAQAGVMGQVNTFLEQPKGPSAAEIQLRQAQDDSMSDALSLARSARGGAGASNRALRVAMAENAATQSGGARDLALLRAKEEEANRAQFLQGLGLNADLAGGMDQRDLQALGLQQNAAAGMDTRALEGLGLSAELASGLDRDTLQALGLSGDLASNIRNAGVTERGQTLGAGTDLMNNALGSTTQVTTSGVPAYLRSDDERAKLGYELTPDQKLFMAGLGATGDVLSLFM